MSTPTWTRNGFTIRDKDHFSISMGKLCMEELYSDIVLISEQGVRHPAHRALLAARSEYFSKLLYGGLKETTEKDVKIMCSDEILRTVLQFLYSGEVKLSPESSADYLMTLLTEVQLMCIDNLKDALEDFIVDHFIKKRNDTALCVSSRKDVIEILNVAVTKDFSKIKGDALKFLKPCIDEVLKCPDLLGVFSSHGLKSILSADDLDLPEIEIFRGIVKWMENNLNSEGERIINPKEKEALLKEVRLDQVTTKQLTMEVWPSGLFTDNEILLAIKEQQENSFHSRSVILNQNICLLSMGAKVIRAVKSANSSTNVIIDGKTNGTDYDFNRGYAMSKLGERLEVELPSKQKINKIRILLYDRDFLKLANGSYVNEAHWSYSYRIQSSMDKVNWNVIADFGNLKGRSWQTIFFPERRMKYVGIIGIKEHLNYTGARYNAVPLGYIHVVAIEAMLDTNTKDEARKNSGMA